MSEATATPVDGGSNPTAQEQLSPNHAGVSYFEQTTTPALPASGYRKVYAKSDGLYMLDSLGNEKQLNAAGLILMGTYAALPAAGTAERFYYATDTLTLYYDNGTTWDTVLGGTHTHDDRYFTEAEVTSLLAGKSATGHTHTESEITDIGTHTHDTRYYTEGEVDTALSGKSDTTHDHSGTYAPAAQGVTNGDTHDHSGGDGAQIDHAGLANKGTNTHALIDAHIADGAIHAGANDGWTDTGETLTYASATTFTVPGDQTAKYAKGTRVKLVQTTTKYFVVTGSAYSDPTTTVTVTGGDDYSLANAAITSPQYSYTNPPDYPTFFNWTPTWSCSGSMTLGSITLDHARFAVTGKIVTFEMRATGTTGGTTSSTIYATLPINAEYATTNSALVSISTVWRLGFSTIALNKPDQVLFRNWDSSNMSLEVKTLMASGTYEID